MVIVSQNRLAHCNYSSLFVKLLGKLKCIDCRARRSRGTGSSTLAPGNTPRIQPLKLLCPSEGGTFLALNVWLQPF